MTIYQLVLAGCFVNNRKVVSYNNDNNEAFDRSILHIMQYSVSSIVYHTRALRPVPRLDKLFTKGLFMKFNGSVSL